MTGPAYRIFQAATGSLRLILYRHGARQLDTKRVIGLSIETAAQSKLRVSRNWESIELVAIDSGFRLDETRPVTPVTVLRFLGVDDPSRLKRKAVIGGTEFEENFAAQL